ncbi:MAG: aminotransferase class I/II-fold pyridoxal phosphate-dependent enzyme [Oscillospiraceae bacterium]|jgi:arginine/lysine/ornithine decarboxylase|nr:aminotransferase class I/II-fold pyridoxal phosphate-dependent enzyme [Oscillospiraceae bacterium]
MRSLADSIKKYIDQNPIRFHMPGHKGIGTLEQYDLTELPGLDNLYNSRGCIKELENNIGNLYGCRSIISTGGATLCIQTMMASTLNPGNKIIVDRHIHISVLNTMILLDLHPVWIYRASSARSPFGAVITKEQLAATIKANPDARAVFVTGQDYYGFSPDLKALSGVCKQNKLPLLVDNAHGAYLKFLNPSAHPIELGADMCCDSWHKVFPTFTGAAVLHMQEQFDPTFAKQRMRLFGSSSPSYLVMNSIDNCLDYIKTQFAPNFKDFINRLANLKEELKALGFQLLNEDENSFLKLTISGVHRGVTGFELQEKLAKQRVYVEYADHNCVILLVGTQNAKTEFAQLINILKTASSRPAIPMSTYSLQSPLIQKKSLPAAAWGRYKQIALKDCNGLVAGLQELKCPPCVPLIMPGEVIDSEVINVLKLCRYHSINCVG